jgi:lipoprotein-anchoring transpeptidase ErfK/SrfK
MNAMGVRALVASTFAVAAGCFCAAPGALADNSARQAVVALPAAGELTVPKVVARSAPNPSAARVLVLHQFRPDFRQQEVLAVGATIGADGRLWYRLSLPMRPNNTTGWVAARQLELRHVATRILINIDKRRLQILRGNHVLYTTTVAVGRPGMETPTGHYYVQVRFHPDDTFLGVFAFETSAYSKLSEWPGGGVVGIHGTSMPQLLGQAVSHGCVRMSNQAALVLKRLVPLGTPITIVQR